MNPTKGAPAVTDNICLSIYINKKGRRGTAHTSVNPNSGTSIPNTTSGTLNSTVNPNTQLVIPIRKSKKKSNHNVAPDSGISTPGK